MIASGVIVGVESALVLVDTLLRRLSLCRSESANGVLLIVLLLAAGVESFCGFSFAAIPMVELRLILWEDGG
jgi:hypothetical protein